MGKHWRNYSNGPYRLGQLKGEAVVTWRDELGRHRYRLAVYTEAEGRSALDAWVRKRGSLASGGRYSIAEIWKAYRDDREKDGKQVAAFDYNWKALEPTFGAMYPADITADLCRRYTRERCVDQGKSQNTAWTELQRLRSCMNWALKKRLVEYPPDIWVPQKPEGKDRVLTPTEVQALLDGCVMPHMRVFVVLALCTAGRTEALLELTWDRVDFDAGTVNLRVKAIANPLLKTVRKGRSVVPMNAWLAAVLQEAKAGAITDHVIEWNGEPVKSIRTGFDAAAERAKLVGVTPHTLRHTAASWMESDEIPMAQISRFLAHSTEAVTRKIYAKPESKLLRKASEVVELRVKSRDGSGSTS